MEIDKLEDNLNELSVELTALKHITDGLDKSGDQQIYHWLKNVERIAGDNDEMQARLDTLRRPYASNNHNGSVELDEILIKELNVKVIESLEVVHSLKEKAFETFLLQITEDKLKRYSHDDLIMFTSEFSHKIGNGGFSNVYSGRLSDGVQVAAKVLKQNHYIPKDVIRDIFVTEVSTMIKTSHPNLIKLYGFCFDDNMKALVYEYMENGSLDKVLFKKHIVVEWRRLYEIAIDTAKVLAYLHHDCDDQIIHHDIKPANILLDSNLSPKVTDFGVAKIMNRDVTHFTMTRTRGTSCYIAPELTIQASRVTYTCDVYSFGMTLFDILGMRINSQTQPSFPNEVWRKFDKGKLDEIINECHIREEDAESARILSMVALWCIQFTPEIRPSMKDVVNVLEKKLHVAAPPNPFLGSDKLFSIRQSQDMTYSTVSTSTHQSLPRGNSTMDTLQEGDEELFGTELVEVLPEVRPSMKDAPPNPFLGSDKLFPIRQSQDMTYSTVSTSTHQSLPGGNSTMDTLQEGDEELFGTQLVEVLPEVRPSMKDAVNVREKNLQLAAPPNPFEQSIGSPSTRQSLPRGNSTINTLKKWAKNVFKRNRSILPKTTLKQYSHKDLKSFTKNFSTKVCSGGFSDLYKGQFTKGAQILVKVLLKSDDTERLEVEMKAISVTSHRNVIKLYGYCNTKNMKALVLEYMEHGSLDEILFYPFFISIEWHHLYHIATETAKGVAYLHDGCKELIIHGDINLTNILLDSSLSPKVANFDLAILADRDLTSKAIFLSGFAGTCYYTAPELDNTSHITSKCDVYSFGILLFDIFRRQRIVRGEVGFWRVCWEHFENGQMDEFLTENGFTDENREKATLFLMVGFWCIQYTPAARPPMKAVVMMLEEDKEVSAPPNPYHSSKLVWS